MLLLNNLRPSGEEVKAKGEHAPPTNANCQPLQFGDTKEKKHERKKQFPDIKISGLRKIL